MGDLEQVLDGPHNKLHPPVVKGNIHNISTWNASDCPQSLMLPFGWM